MRKMRLKIFIFPCLMYRTCSRTELIGIIESFRFSRSVDINDGDRPGSGVLLVDMKYSVVENVLKQINESSDGVYYYVCNRDGELLYHPRRAEIDRELFKENSLKAAGYEDGVYEISSGNGKENVIVGSISYTGWKLIGVIPESVQTANINNFRYYIFTTIIILMMLLLGGKPVNFPKSIKANP